MFFGSGILWFLFSVVGGNYVFGVLFFLCLLVAIVAEVVRWWRRRRRRPEP